MFIYFLYKVPKNFIHVYPCYDCINVHFGYETDAKIMGSYGDKIITRLATSSHDGFIDVMAHVIRLWFIDWILFVAGYLMNFL